jgi:hypothetical protein
MGKKEDSGKLVENVVAPRRNDDVSPPMRLR